MDVGMTVVKPMAQYLLQMPGNLIETDTVCVVSSTGDEVPVNQVYAAGSLDSQGLDDSSVSQPSTDH